MKEVNEEDWEKSFANILTRVNMSREEMVELIADATSVVDSMAEHSDIENFVKALDELYKIVGYKPKDIRQFYMISGVVLYKVYAHHKKVIYEVMKRSRENN
jgi:hypothetical protein